MEKQKKQFLGMLLVLAVLAAAYGGIHVYNQKQEEKAVADSSKDIQLRELKDMINDLKKMIKTLQATVDAANKREEALTQERDNLKAEIDLLRKKLFGTSSEKRSLDIPGQLNFFNEAELEQDPKAAEADPADRAPLGGRRANCLRWKRRGFVCLI